MAANGGFNPNARMNRSGFITANHCHLIWKISGMSYFENIRGDGQPMKMSLGLIKN